MDAEVTCLEEQAGVDVQGPLWDARHRFLTYTYTVEGDATANEAAMKSEAACSEQFRSLVETVWAEQTLPSSDRRAELGRHLSACLADAGAVGVESGSLPSANLLAQLDNGDMTSSQRQCFDRYADFFAVERPRT